MNAIAAPNAPAVPRRRVVWLRLAAGVVLIAVILRMVGVQATFNLIARAAPRPLLLAIAAYFLMYVLKAWRWRVFLATQAFELPFARALHQYLLSSLVGAFTPGRIGEASRILGPAQGNRRYAESFACTAVDKAFDIWLLVALLILASCSTLLSPPEALALRLTGATAIAASLVGLLMLFRLAARDPQLPPRLLRLLPAGWSRALADHPRRALAATAESLRRGWLPGIVLTALFWVAHVTCHYLILRALGVTMDLPYFILCLTLVGLVEFVPITICGLGTREVLLIYLFGRAALSSDIAVAFGLFSVFFTYAVTGAFTLLVTPFVRSNSP